MKVELNNIFFKMKGNLGNYYIYNKDGVTSLRKRPTKSVIPPSAKQLECRRIFAEKYGNKNNVNQ